MSKKTRVVFLRQHGAYIKGDVAGFEGEALERLKALTPAVVAECDAKGKPLAKAKKDTKASDSAIATKKDTKASDSADADKKPEPGAPPAQGAQ